MVDSLTLALVTSLVDPERRGEQARILARYLGGDDLIIFVMDADVGMLLPAPGFPQTLSEGRRWRSFLRACRHAGTQIDHLPFASSSGESRVVGIAAQDGTVLALLNGTPCLARLSDVRESLPLLAATFRMEWTARAERNRARLADENAARAKLLAERLDTSRRDLEFALGEAEAARKRSAALAQDRDKALAQAEVERKRLNTLYDAIAAGVMVVEESGEIVHMNGAAQDILGFTCDEMWGRTAGFHWEAVREDGTALPLSDAPPLVALREQNVIRGVTLGFMRRDGERRWLQMDATPVVGEEGELLQVVTSFTDITARTRAEQALRESEMRKRAILEMALDCIITIDDAGNILEFNPAAERTFGYSRGEVIGRDMAELIVPPALRAAHRDGLARYLATRQAHMLGMRVEITAMRANGEEFPVEMAITCIPTDGPPLFTGYLRDISERKRAEAKLSYQALHDALTGLPNRTLLHSRGTQALQRAQKVGEPVALLLLDLNHFKEVNDTFGHHYGDLLLTQVSQRLTDIVRRTDTVARLGGDEFAVVLQDSDAEGSSRMSDAILRALDTPFIVEGQSVQVGTSIGLTIFPEHGSDMETLLRCADIAMYVAKRNHLGTCLYAPAQDQHSPDRLALIADLREAILDGGLELHYQPVANLRPGAAPPTAGGRWSGDIRWVEALARWNHPSHGFVSPNLFIPLAEQTGLITALTRSVLEAALRQCAEWRRRHTNLGVALNISAWDVYDPDFPDCVANLLHMLEVPPGCLQLELTESVVMTDASRTLNVLERLARLGVQLSVDDFGTGYSSLSYLKRLPVNLLKIDRSFVCTMATDEADLSIVRSTISLGHALGLGVVAEGVEDERTWTLLCEMGCDRAQGYFISAPRPPGTVDGWLATCCSMSPAVSVSGAAAGRLRKAPRAS